MRYGTWVAIVALVACVPGVAQASLIIDFGSSLTLVLESVAEDVASNIVTDLPLPPPLGTEPELYIGGTVGTSPLGLGFNTVEMTEADASTVGDLLLIGDASLWDGVTSISFSVEDTSTVAGVGFSGDDIAVDRLPIPEPSSLALALAVAAALGWRRRAG